MTFSRLTRASTPGPTPDPDAPEPHRISPQLRTTLDIVRIVAAVYVVIHHVTARMDTGALAPLFSFGQEAVMAFFLLSGFVIHANERARLAGPAPDRSGYALRRGLRIYPTLLCAMALSVAVAAMQGDLAQRFDPREGLCTLLALQDAGALKPGTLCRPFMGNTPLWSLSYEILFYLIYPLVLPLFLRRPRLTQNVLGLVTLALIGLYVATASTLALPAHVARLGSYFLIWWCGAMMAERCLSPAARDTTVLLPLAWLVAATVLWGVVAARAGALGEIGVYPMLMVRHFGVAALFVLLALSPAGAWVTARLGRGGRALWAWLSGISYGIYVFHFPLLIQYDLAGSAAGFALSCGLVVLAAEIGDRRLSRALRPTRSRPQRPRP